MSSLVPLPPKVSINRRMAAFAIDAFNVWLLTFLLGTHGLVQTLLFLTFWFLSRIVIVYRNQGQSLGRWALDMKVVDSRFMRTPGFQELCKREGILGLFTALAVLSLDGLTSTNAFVLVLMIPLGIDAILPLTDTGRYRQTLHDRIGKTVIIGTRRGYSLDIKLKKLLDQVQRNMRP